MYWLFKNKQSHWYVTHKPHVVRENTLLFESFYVFEKRIFSWRLHLLERKYRKNTAVLWNSLILGIRRSFRNHSNILIWCLRYIYYKSSVLKTTVLLNIRNHYTVFHDYFMNRKFKLLLFFLNRYNVIKVCTVNCLYFDQLNVSLANNQEKTKTNPKLFNGIVSTPKKGLVKWFHGVFKQTEMIKRKNIKV